MLKRVDAYEKVTGRAVYADDIKLDQMLYAKQVYSIHPHAKIISINADKARKIPEVVDIITANDCTGSMQVGGITQDHYVLAYDKVRYIGDVVAVVAATTYEAARKGAEAISVEYEKLEPILDPEKAMEETSPKVHDDKESNLIDAFTVRFGKADSVFEKADEIIEAEFETQLVEHAYMEPESCIAVKNPDSSITIYGGMQHPFSTRRYVACFLGMPLNKIRIIQTTLGGGFGGKDDTISVVCARAALLAKQTEKPVKLTLTREESIRESYKRHPFKVKLRACVDKKNKLHALRSEIITDGGPYCAVSPFVIWRPTVQCTGPYKIPNVSCDSSAVYTNNPLTGAMRGFGTPQYNFAIESFIDIIAEKLKIDPINFRLNNFFKQGDTTHTGQELSGHTVSIYEVTTKALEKFSWQEKYKKCSRGKPDSNNKYHGVGLACSYRGVSLGAEGNDFCSAIVNIQEDASVILQVGVSENGQGSKTAMTRIAATELGIDPESIIYLDSDTSNITDGGPTVASRGTLVGGNAVLNATKQIKEQMKPVLAKLIGRSKSEYIYSKNKIINHNNKKEVSFKDAARACHNNKMYLYAFGTWKGPSVGWEKKRGRGDAYFTYVYGCNLVEVEIDGSTGKVSTLNAIAAHDVGRAINPTLLLGQIYGGMTMGLGQALTEEIINNKGEIQNLNLNKYKIPRTTDIPKMEAIIVENPDKAGPWGAKSIGEPTNEMMAGAIANAIYNATGYRSYKLPIRAKEILGYLETPPLSEAVD